MIRLVFALIASLLLVAPASAQLAPLHGGGTDTANAASRPFTALHTYYLAASGCNDGYDGSSPTHTAGNVGPWCSPNHRVVCGDAIIASAGTYNNGQFSGTWGAVNNCPSSSGGIDGSGGIYFAVLLCGATDLMGCRITNGKDAAAVELYGGAHNWAVEGFVIPNVIGYNGFQVRIVSYDCNTYYSSHHIAFINNVVYNSQQAIGLNDCGKARGSHPPAADYLAAVGNIAQNAAQNSICLGAIDFVGTGQTDANTTAIKGFMAGNFSWNNQNSACNSKYDNVGLMFDTLDAHDSNGIWNALNNVSYYSGRYGYQLFWQCASLTPFTVNIYNNTLFANNATSAITNTSLAGDMNVSANGSCTGFNPIPVTVNIYNNIAKSNWATFGGSGGGSVYALAMSIHNSGSSDTWSHWGLLTNGTAGNENIWKGQRNRCTIFNGQGGCDSGFNINWTDSVSRLGTNYYEDPSFANESELLKNRLGPPDCSGFASTTQCMGWDATTRTLTTPSVISDLVASCTHCSGKGYQLPSTTCVNGGTFYDLFPTWLKGVVYLHWTGAQITQNFGLLTLPCGL